jgi:hypothetical protein
MDGKLMVEGEGTSKKEAAKAVTCFCHSLDYLLLAALILESSATQISPKNESRLLFRDLDFSPTPCCIAMLIVLHSMFDT